MIEKLQHQELFCRERTITLFIACILMRFKMRLSDLTCYGFCEKVAMKYNIENIHSSRKQLEI